VVPTPRKGREEWGTLFVLVPDDKINVNVNSDASGFCVAFVEPRKSSFSFRG